MPSTSSYDPFEFHGNAPPRQSTEIDPKKKQLFLEDLEKLRNSIRASGEVAKKAISFKETPRPLLGVTVSPKAFASQETAATTVPIVVSGTESTPSAADREPKSHGGPKRKRKTEFFRRNMLMNIILRPGGGDKSRALPRPKVDVHSEGANVIVVRMTFPENENIQGLRAYTPKDDEDLDKLADIEDILPPNASVERIEAVSHEDDGAVVKTTPKPKRAVPEMQRFKLSEASENVQSQPAPPPPNGAYSSFFIPVDKPRPPTRPSRPPKRFRTYQEVRALPLEKPTLRVRNVLHPHGSDQPLGYHYGLRRTDVKRPNAWRQLVKTTPLKGLLQKIFPEK